jgi:hypothetical protein
VIRKVAATLPAMLRFGSFEIGLGFEGGVCGCDLTLNSVVLFWPRYKVIGGVGNGSPTAL